MTNKLFVSRTFGIENDMASLCHVYHSELWRSFPGRSLNPSVTTESILNLACIPFVPSFSCQSTVDWPFVIQPIFWEPNWSTPFAHWG